MPDETKAAIDNLAKEIVTCRREGKPVILFTGAHLIKNGLGPLIIDLIEKNIFTLVAGNAATSIHDFELALQGETSEYVPDALGKGMFGMAHEFAYMNTALKMGNARKWGYGESLGRIIVDLEFRKMVFAEAASEDSWQEFLHPEVSVLAACFRHKIPFTVHVGIGVDVIDQHPSFDGEAKGGCSGRDFLIFVHEITKFVKGGVFLNIGSAIQGPEVLLKSVSMAANSGFAPSGIICADFDLREFRPEEMADEQKMGYYFRDQKSVVTRIPAAFGGQGIYVQGNQLSTIVYFYQKIMDEIERVKS
ncbi:hypothetical protein B6D60_10765 [candidate division KSB1 bacterium 4484_87]|nr:MAG: hypothetical protein B6D60_10765 [candidate division KSB1 bacterium 4484_87]